MVISLCQSNYLKSSVLVVFHNPQHTEQNNAADNPNGADGIIIPHTLPDWQLPAGRRKDPIIWRGPAFLLPKRERENPWLHLCYLENQQRLPLGMCKTNSDILLDGQWGGHHPGQSAGFKILSRLINRCSRLCKILISRPYGLKFISLSCLLPNQYFQEPP